MRYATLLVAFGFLSPAPVRAAPAAEVPGSPLPGGIADPAGRTGFVASAAGGIEAVDLATGDVLWTTNEAQRPILVVGDRLYAQAGLKRNRLRVLAFDLTAMGECRLESDPVVLPAWVVTSDTPTHSFTAHWRLEKNQLVLAWEATALPGGRAGQPAPLPDTAERKHADGVARIDLETGKVELRPAEKAPPAARKMARQLEKLAVRWQGVTGKTFTAVVLEEAETAASPAPPAGSKEQKLVLRSWDLATEEANPPKELLRGKRLLVQPTLDERYLCVRDAGVAPEEKGTGEDHKKQDWSVFAVETGELFVRVPFESGTQALTILGPRAFLLMAGPIKGPIDRPFVHPRSLKAVELKTGKTLWERPIEGKQVAPPP
jgi:hypothetical protein